jgi:hypothetical protein
MTCSRDTSQLNKIREFATDFEKAVFDSIKHAALHGKLGAPSQANRREVVRALDQRHWHVGN